jgi:hypothetical protein
MIDYNSDIEKLYFLTDKEIQIATGFLKQWRIILLSRAIIDRKKVTNIIKQAYEILKLSDISIIFVKGINNAVKLIKREFPVSDCDPNVLYCNDNYQPLISDLFYLFLQNNEKSYNRLSPHSDGIAEILVREEDIFGSIYSNIFTEVHQISEYYLSKIIDIEARHVNNCHLQYWIEDKKLNHNLEAWNILKNLSQECPYLIPLSKFCIVIDRPIEIYLDNEGLPHAYNHPAMIFGDGSKVYYHHGIPLSAKYGEVPINDWQPEWILSEETYEEQSVLIYAIGYKRFRAEYPEVDFWREYDRLFYESANRFLCESVDIIINWQLYHHNQLYLKYSQTDALKINPDDAIKIIDTLPFKLPTELANLYQYYNGGYQLTPGLYFYPIKQAIQALTHLTWIKSDTGYPFPLFKGTRDEIYYVLADDPEPTYSHVYCIFPGEEPIVYAECVTSLIVTIAQCYQEGAYYIAIDEETGERTIEQDLDKIEPIFEKFNPDQIDTWRSLWKS